MNINVVHVVLIVVISYLLGSIPTAYLIAQFKHIDIFQVGSGNMGATNVARSLGFKWGLLVWFFDSAKGIIAVLIAGHIMGYNRAAATTISAIVAIVGHNWSLFATLLTGSIRGGKGAATAFGTLLMIAPAQTILVGFALAGTIIILTRYMSLGVLLMFSLSFSWIAILSLQRQMPMEFVFYSFSMGGLILLRFRENIERLLAGTERRLGDPA
ncbi:MAG TPA: glycerol-3-phosphate acyltransferase [Phototrophicaceae bacterium]|jgi:glycerol-3-phosphate acyltransferase PlsY|nr:glycerol-3-phosphate acyltransferase [Phototrophicaceae bacterium]